MNKERRSPITRLAQLVGQMPRVNPLDPLGILAGIEKTEKERIEGLEERAKEVVEEGEDVAITGHGPHYPSEKMMTPTERVLYKLSNPTKSESRKTKKEARPVAPSPFEVLGDLLLPLRMVLLRPLELFEFALPGMGPLRAEESKEEKTPEEEEEGEEGEVGDIAIQSPAT